MILLICLIQYYRKRNHRKEKSNWDCLDCNAAPMNCPDFSSMKKMNCDCDGDKGFDCDCNQQEGEEMSGYLNLIPCHCIPERCFHFKGKPMRLCARCFAMMLGYRYTPIAVGMKIVVPL